MRNLIFVLLFSTLFSYGQSDSVFYKQIHSRDSILGIYPDTSFYYETVEDYKATARLEQVAKKKHAQTSEIKWIQKRLSMKSTGMMVLKPFNVKFDLEIRDGWWRYWDKYSSLTDSVLFSIGFVTISKNFYSNGKLHTSTIFDTLSPMVLKGFGMFAARYERSYYRHYNESGVIESEGNYFRKKKKGEWIFYDKNGGVRKRKKY
jgi:antitoxin component YwqK of YwqJK toxin-antitoxin module